MGENNLTQWTPALFTINLSFIINDRKCRFKGFIAYYHNPFISFIVFSSTNIHSIPLGVYDSLWQSRFFLRNYIGSWSRIVRSKHHHHVNACAPACKLSMLSAMTSKSPHAHTQSIVFQEHICIQLFLRGESLHITIPINSCIDSGLIFFSNKTSCKTWMIPNETYPFPMHTNKCINKIANVIFSFLCLLKLAKRKEHWKYNTLLQLRRDY